MVHYLMGRYEVSERRATRAARFCLSSIRYQSCRDPLTALRQRMRELAQTRVRFGYRRLLVLLRREGWDARQEAVLSPLHRGGAGAAAEAAVAPRDGGAPRAATTGDRAQ